MKSYIVFEFLQPNLLQDITSKIKLLNGLKICQRVKLPIGFWGTMIIGGNSDGIRII